MRKNILVVKKENGSKDSYGQIFREDHRVVKTSSGEEALRKISKNNFHLLIIDLGLPGTKSLELLRMVRRLDSGIPVIMLSAVNTVEMAVKAMKSGTNNYLTKPLDLNELQETVEELSDKYLETYNRLPLDIEIVINEVKEDMLAKGAGLREAGNNFEKKLLKTVLKKVDGDREKAANFLGVDDKVLSGKMAAFSLSPPKPVLSIS